MPLKTYLPPPTIHYPLHHYASLRASAKKVRYRSPHIAPKDWVKKLNKIFLDNAL